MKRKADLLSVIMSRSKHEYEKNAMLSNGNWIQRRVINAIASHCDKRGKCGKFIALLCSRRSEALPTNFD